MKKTLMIAAAAVVVLGLASCGNCNNGSCSKDSKNYDEDRVYTGFLPAADCDGIRYTLKLDYDDDEAGLTKGDYDLLETYVKSDSVSTKDVASFKSEGDFTEISKEGKSYLKLIQDAKDSSQGSNAGPLYFYVESDSTLVMVNSDLQVSETPGLNYTLKLVK